MSLAFGGFIVVYNYLDRTTSVLCETWAEDWQKSFIQAVQTIGDAAHIPSCILLILLRFVFQEYQAISQDLYIKVARIGIDLDMEPFLHDRIPDRMEDYRDLAKTTQDLTKLAQQAAQLKSNLEGHQELVAATHTVHEEYSNRIRGPTSQEATSACSEIRNKLQFLATDIREQQRRVDVQMASVQAQIQTVCEV